MPEISRFYVTKAEVLHDYVLDLTFSDGSRKHFDMAPILKKDYPVYKGLDDPKVFRDIALDGWTVTWKNGTADIAPEYLYENGIPA